MYLFFSLMEIRAFYEQREQEILRRFWNTFGNRLILILVMLYVVNILFTSISIQWFLFFSHLEWIKCTTFGIKVWWERKFSCFWSTFVLFFCLSSREGHVNIVQELLSRGANVNAATKVFQYQNDNRYSSIISRICVFFLFI